MTPRPTTSRPHSVGSTAPRLCISENRRFLVHEDGRPFFYLADTAWELFHRSTREEAEFYLQARARQGFTVVQAVLLAEEDGLNTPNAYGRCPLRDLDPTRPAIVDGPDNDYWDHVDFIVARAGALGLTMGLLPTWGDKWNRKWGQGPEVFTPENARVYGMWLGRRYRDANVIWILGGDRAVETETHAAIVCAMAAGLREGDGGTHLISFHPGGGRGSAESFHDEAWLDFNMRQNGHEAAFNPRYEMTRKDYDRTPVKPVLDAEPLYEGHPISFKAAEQGQSVAADVRRPLYWDLFTGACGHTYGHHAVWQMWRPGIPPKNSPLLPWTEAIEAPGARQMVHARRLLESRPFLTRLPDDSVIVPDSVPTRVPGAGLKRLVATRDGEGRYAMVYTPASVPFRVRLNAIAGPTVRAWWFNPRTGAATELGEFPNAGERTFEPPDAGEMLDWVLVLDDVAAAFPPPGTGAFGR